MGLRDMVHRAQVRRACENDPQTRDAINRLDARASGDKRVSKEARQAAERRHLFAAQQRKNEPKS